MQTEPPRVSGELIRWKDHSHVTSLEAPARAERARGTDGVGVQVGLPARVRCDQVGRDQVGHLTPVAAEELHYAAKNRTQPTG